MIPLHPKSTELVDFKPTMAAIFPVNGASRDQHKPVFAIFMGRATLLLPAIIVVCIGFIS